MADYDVHKRPLNGFLMSTKKIVGRKKELEILKEIYRSKEAEFLAVYGRRRVGKTFLVREFFSNKGTYFEITGQKNGKLQDQLKNFALILAKTFPQGDLPLKIPKSWKGAFELSRKQILHHHRLSALDKFLHKRRRVEHLKLKGAVHLEAVAFGCCHYKRRPLNLSPGVVW